MTDKIAIDLNNHELLLLELRTLLESATSLYNHLNLAATSLPNLSSSGEFHNRVATGGGGEEAANLPAHFVLKAQTFQSLVTVLYKHTSTTHASLIRTDRLLAIDIANTALSDPSLPEDVRQDILANPETYVTRIQEENKNAGLTNESLAAEGGSLDDYLMVYNMLPTEGEG